ncbi:hypothetical protein [Neisseria sp. Ec49-e6-T10]|uniref:hypothetical protein n=1 Tax=Neisseria sp. Ec49-e6-T10 TaxID=3140744 RepID=UPI003EB9D0B5
MSVNASISTELRAKVLAADTAVAIDQSVVKDGFRDFIFIITGTGAAATISEISTVDVTDTVVPLERLVFNNNDLDSGDITLNETNNEFTIAAGKIVFVGVYLSAYHDQLKASVASTLLARGHTNPVGVWA